MWTPGQADLVVPQGSTFDPVWTLKDSAGQPVDLSGWTAAMKVRETVDSTTATFSLASGSGITLGGAAGTIAPVIAAADLAALVFTGNSKTYVFDLELTDGSSRVRRVLQGRFTVTREITR